MLILHPQCLFRYTMCLLIIISIVICILSAESTTIYFPAFLSLISYLSNTSLASLFLATTNQSSTFAPLTNLSPMGTISITTSKSLHVSSYSFIDSKNFQVKFEQFWQQRHPNLFLPDIWWCFTEVT